MTESKEMSVYSGIVLVIIGILICCVYNIIDIIAKRDKDNKEKDDFNRKCRAVIKTGIFLFTLGVLGVMYHEQQIDNLNVQTVIPMYIVKNGVLPIVKILVYSAVTSMIVVLILCLIDLMINKLVSNEKAKSIMLKILLILKLIALILTMILLVWFCGVFIDGVGAYQRANQALEVITNLK